METLDASARLSRVSQRARALTGATGVAIALAHKNSMICRASAGSNAPPLGSRLDVTSGLSGECVRSGKALRCDDSESDPRVDLISSRRLRVRSILAAPILFENEVVGILEIFSPQPFAFNDGHLAMVKALAEALLHAPPQLKPTQPPSLSVQTEPAFKVFFRNLPERLLPPENATICAASAPAQFWPDVFVPSRLPWKHLAQSLLLHVVMLAAAGSFLTWSLPRTRFVYPAWDGPEVLYYSRFEYPRTAKRKVFAGRAARQRSEPAEEATPVVPERREALAKPPAIKLKRDIHILHILGWSSIAPTVPASVVSRSRLITPAALVGLIAPPPEILAMAVSRALVIPGANIIEPSPSVDTSFRSVRNISIQAMEIVGPAPRMPRHEHNPVLATLEAGLHSAMNSVVAPPPAMGDLNTTGNRVSARINALAGGVVPPPPQIAGAATVKARIQNGAEIAVLPPASPAGQENASALAGDVPGNRSGVAPKSVMANASPMAGRSTNNVQTYAAKRIVKADSGMEAEPANPKELSVEVIAPVLPLPSSSYFASSEVFIAEEQLSSHQRRLIKLVYDYLPYQKRLSDYGPNYPKLDKLRVARDATCDETLREATSSMTTPEISAGDGARLSSQPGVPQQTKLPCFRTTADDYRRARIHAHN